MTVFETNYKESELQNIKLERLERGAHNLLKVANGEPCDAVWCQEWATQDEGLRRSKQLKSEVSNYELKTNKLNTCLKSEVSNWGLLANNYMLIYVKGQ